MKFLHNKAFTLIELLISITIFFILTMVTYVPYNFYMNKVKVRNTIKEISQSLYEARNMAINWISNWSNRSVWLYIDIEEKDTLNFFSYPHAFTSNKITKPIFSDSDSDIEFIKSYKLLEWMKLRSINWKNNWLFFFDAITWKWKYYYWDDLLDRETISNDKIYIEFSFKNAVVWSSLYWKITYFTKTNIVDY